MEFLNEFRPLVRLFCIVGGKKFHSLGPVILKDDSVISRFDLGKKYELLDERVY